MSRGSTGKTWRRQLALVRGWRLLVGPSPPAHAAACWVQKRSDAELNVAAQLPDHSPEGRSLAAAALAARGGRVSPFAATAPSFVSAKDLKSGRALFFGWSCSMRRIAGGVVGVGLFSLALTLTAALFAPPPFAQMATVAVRGFALLAGAGGLAWTIAVALRARPARILVVRHSEDRRHSKDLDRIVTHALRPFGHIIALCDQPLRRRRFAWTADAMQAAANPAALIATFLATPARLASRLLDKSRYGAAMISSARDFRALGRRLTHRIGLNFEVSLTPREALFVRTTQQWRLETADLLFRSSDAIVIDLTPLTDANRWALDRLQAAGLMARVVLICRQDAMDQAQIAIGQDARTLSHPIIAYRRGGKIEDETVFQETILSAITHRVTRT